MGSMNVLQRGMQQTEITFWKNTGSDGFGGFTYDSPIMFEGRWQEESVIFTSFSGEQRASRSVVYVDYDVEEGDFLAEGDYTDYAAPTDVPDSNKTVRRVEAFSRATDLAGLQELRKAFLV